MYEQDEYPEISLDLAGIHSWLRTCWIRHHEALGRAVPPDPSEGMCRHTVLLLDRILRDAGAEGWEITAGHCRVRGSEGNEYRWLSRTVLSDPTNKVIYNDVEKESDATLWQDWIFDEEKNVLTGRHWWLQKDGHIIDLTASQFGWEPVLGAITDDRYQIDEGTGPEDVMDGFCADEDIDDYESGTETYGQVEECVERWLSEWEYLKNNLSLIASKY